jgi:transcriptional regulator with XRE-family HTH domain
VSKTLKEWREHRGLSREELAGRVGVVESMVERWEEVGLDAEPGSRLGDLFIGKLMEALEVEEGLMIEHVPDSPKVGDLVITPGPDLGIEELLERAEELNLRIVIPDAWGQTLKPPAEATDEDYGAIEEHFRKESAYALSVSERVKNVVEMLGGNDGRWKDGQLMRDRLEEVVREAVEDLEGSEEGTS